MKLPIRTDRALLSAVLLFLVLSLYAQANRQRQSDSLWRLLILEELGDTGRANVPAGLPTLYRNNEPDWLASRVLPDSLFNMEKAKEFTLLKLKHDLERAEQEYALALKRKDDEIQYLQLRNRSISVYLTIGVAGLLGAVVFLLALNSRQKREANRRLARQKAALEKAGEELRANREKLGQSNRILNNFVFATSHDLKESVRSVTSFGQLLERRLLDGQTDSAHQYAGFIAENGRRMDQTLEKLLLMSELIDTGLPPCAPFDLEHAARQAWAELLQERKPGACSLDIETLPEACGDTALLYQLISYLLENAIEFRKEGEFLAVRLSYEPSARAGTGAFVVRDNGQGVGAEYLNSIFEPFMRLNPRGKGGAGLGLSICSRIVELHGGTAWAEPVELGGLAVYFRLPLATVQQKESEPALS